MAKKGGKGSKKVEKDSAPKKASGRPRQKKEEAPREESRTQSKPPRRAAYLKALILIVGPGTPPARKEETAKPRKSPRRRQKPSPPPAHPLIDLCSRSPSPAPLPPPRRTSAVSIVIPTRTSGALRRSGTTRANRESIKAFLDFHAYGYDELHSEEEEEIRKKEEAKKAKKEEEQRRKGVLERRLGEQAERRKQAGQREKKKSKGSSEDVEGNDAQEDEEAEKPKVKKRRRNAMSRRSADFFQRVYAQIGDRILRNREAEGGAGAQEMHLHQEVPRPSFRLQPVNMTMESSPEELEVSISAPVMAFSPQTPPSLNTNSSPAHQHTHLRAPGRSTEANQAMYLEGEENKETVVPEAEEKVDLGSGDTVSTRDDRDVDATLSQTLNMANDSLGQFGNVSLIITPPAGENKETVSTPDKLETEVYEMAGISAEDEGEIYSEEDWSLGDGFTDLKLDEDITESPLLDENKEVTNDDYAGCSHGASLPMDGEEDKKVDSEQAGEHGGVSNEEAVGERDNDSDLDVDDALKKVIAELKSDEASRPVANEGSYDPRLWALVPYQGPIKVELRFPMPFPWTNPVLDEQLISLEERRQESEEAVAVGAMALAPEEASGRDLVAHSETLSLTLDEYIALYFPPLAFPLHLPLVIENAQPMLALPAPTVPEDMEENEAEDPVVDNPADDVEVEVVNPLLAAANSTLLFFADLLYSRAQ